MIRRAATDARGAAFVELVVVLPVIILLLVGSTDFARVFYFSMAVQNAALAGAQYGGANIANSGDTTGMRNRAVAAGVDIGVVLADVTAAQECSCAPDLPGSAAYSLATFTCSVPTVCTAGNHLSTRVQVTVTKTFTTLTAYPGVPSSIPISRTVWMRAQ